MANHALSRNFRAFFTKLNPGSSFEQTASSQYNSIKALLEDANGRAAQLSPVCFLQGSYRQNTAIYTINDVDVVALCRLWYPGSPGAGRSYDRNDIFDIIASPLLNDGRYASKVRYKPTSMCIKVELGIKVEILPVVYKSGNSDPNTEPFVLYRPQKLAWEDGYARYHQWCLSQKNANDRTNGNFIPAIKVLKHLRSRYSLNAVSFHIECILHHLPNNLFVGGPADYITRLLGHIAATPADLWYSSGCSTPCGERNIFAAGEWSLPDWRDFHRAIAYWSATAGLAHRAGYESNAIRHWQELLGSNFFPTQAS